MSKLEVGGRVIVQNSRGTVRYVGNVDSQPGLWLGVEWDDPDRGKHNGTYKERSYFKTRHSTGGSFVRPDKVTEGISFVDALKERYRRNEETDIEDKHLEDMKKNFNAPFVEVVGMGKVADAQSDLGRLKEASVSSSLVSHPGAGISEICPNLEEVDLSSTLLSSWDDVFDIVRHLPKLRILNVSYNRLRPSGASDLHFDSVDHLSLGFMDYDWNEILAICGYFPCLKYLQVPGNRISMVDTVGDQLQSLVRIDLENNCLDKWANIGILGGLHNLKRLNVTRCRLMDIEIKPGEFPSLQVLWLTKNNITSWRHISQLNRIQSLVELHILENPLLDKSNVETNRQQVIARIGPLMILNGTSIAGQERRGAEIDYVRHLAAEWHKAKENPSARQNFVEEHPRFEELADRNGLPELEELETKPKTIKSSLINVTFVLSGASEPITKKIPVTMQVSKLRSLVARLEGGTNEDASLFVASQQAEEGDLNKEQLSMLRKAFDAFDREKKGSISTETVGEIFRLLGVKISQSMLDEIISEVDEDGSGELEFEEFVQLSAKFLIEEDAEELQKELKEAFRLYDKEGNGYITTNTLREILHELDSKLTSDELDDIIEEIDEDGSGTIDFDEFMEMMTGE